MASWANKKPDVDTQRRKWNLQGKKINDSIKSLI